MKKAKSMLVPCLAASVLLGVTACGGDSTTTSATNDASNEVTEEASDAEASGATEAEETTEAASTGAWTAEGNFVDDSDNYLIIYHMLVEDGYEEEGWSVSLISDGDMIGGSLQEQDGALSGDFVRLEDDGSVSEGIAATVTQEGDGVFLSMADGKEYHFTPYEIDESMYESESSEMLPYFQYNEIYGMDSYDAIDAAAYDYLAFDKERDYDPDHVMIPYVQVVAVDETDPSDVLIYGDYLLYEFEKDGDTIVMVSGGHYPGIIHAERFGEGETAIYSAFGMDDALTDDDNQRIFGDYYDDYLVYGSDNETRDAKYAEVIADYVRVNGLDITKYELSLGDVKDLP